MKAAISFGLAFFVLGGAGGALGYKLWDDRHTQPTTTVTTNAAESLKTVSIAEQGIELKTRPTDGAARLTLDDNTTVVGIRIFDAWSGTPASAPAVDLVWERQEKQFDQPSATTLDEYKAPTVPGLTIQETRELSIDGRPALKQLFTMEVAVPGPFGSTSKQPVPNQLRYVIQDGSRFLILRAPGERQTFLDQVAQHLRFVATGSTTEDGLDLNVEGSDTSLHLDAVSPNQGDSGDASTIDISGESVQ